MEGWGGVDARQVWVVSLLVMAKVRVFGLVSLYEFGRIFLMPSCVSSVRLGKRSTAINGHTVSLGASEPFVDCTPAASN